MNLIDNESFLQLYEGSGFGNFLKDQSKKFIKKGIEKAVNTGGEKVGELIVNKIIPSNQQQQQQQQNSAKDKNQKNIYNTPDDEIPIDSGYKIIKLLKKNQPIDNIRKQFNSI